MKKSDLKKLIKEVTKSLEKVEKDPLFVKGFRTGEKEGYIGEKSNVDNSPEAYRLGYKRGYKTGFWKRYGEKITKGLTAVGDFMGAHVNTTRR